MTARSRPDEVSIVTGGASGIGAALAAALVRRGGRVVLADTDVARAAANAERFTRQGPGVAVSAVLDVRDADAFADLVHDTCRSHGRLDHLFNNAGIGMGGEPEELLLEHWERIIDVNLRGVIHGCHAAYPLMKEQGSGHIVNVASLAGLVPSPGWLAPYGTTKHAVVGLSLALRNAGADFGVRVSAVCPGFVETPIIDTRGPADLPTPVSVERSPGLRALLAREHIRLYSADRLAEDVLRGMARNKAIIAAPATARVQWLAWRLSPPAAMWLARRLTRDFRELAQQPVEQPVEQPAQQSSGKTWQ